MITEAETTDRPRIPSGRAVFHRKRRVEECHRLGLAAKRRGGVFDPANKGKLWLSRALLALGGWLSEAVYTLSRDPAGRRKLVSGHTAGPLSEEPVLYEVELTYTPCHFGGRRQPHRNKFEDLERSLRLAAEIAANHWPRSRRKLCRRCERMERTNAGLERFLERAETW